MFTRRSALLLPVTALIALISWPAAAATRSPTNPNLRRARSRLSPRTPTSVPTAPEPSALTSKATQTIGALSVGHPHAGFLINGVRMPEGAEWSLGIPSEAYGTEETIEALIHCIRRVNQQFPNTPRVVIGSLSRQGGGPLPPHKSHRTGRDADVALYYLGGKWRWDQPAGAHNLDRARSWAFLRAVITETDVEFVLVDRVVQELLEEYALGIGEDPEWVRELFHGTASGERPIVKHVPGHTAHWHIRFVSPLACERGRLAYDQLVEQGHIPSPAIEARAGSSPRTRAGSATTTPTGPTELRGARDPVVIPPRKLPGRARSARELEEAATRAALEELERQLDSAR